MSTALTHSPGWDRLKSLALDALSSANSKRAYSAALDQFMAWHTEHHPGESISKAMVNGYRASLEARGLAAATINLALSAVKRLVSEAVDNGLLDPTIGAGVLRVRGVAKHGVRTGNWLTREQAEALLLAPDGETLKGKRDRAILAVMLGAGLRRSEIASLTLAHVQMREGRWVICDMEGKGRRIRSVPMPAWCYATIQRWVESAGISEGLIFRSFHRWDRVTMLALDTESIRAVVQQYAEQVGLGKINPHDLRRSYAKLAHKGRAALEQIQLSLGHASIQTTERYLGVQQDFEDAPCDHLGLRLTA